LLTVRIPRTAIARLFAILAVCGKSPQKGIFKNYHCVQRTSTAIS
jgi:hypothetical protein